MAMSARLLRPRAAGGFNPKTIAGLQLWLDAADASSVTTVSGAASQWNDKSGNGRHATQTTANNRPAYNGVIGGKAALTFDGTNDAMATGLESASLTGYATYFCVCRPNFADATAANVKTPLYGRDSTTSNSYGMNLLNTSGTLTLNTQWRGAGFNQAGGPTVTLGIDAIMVGGITPTQNVRRVNGVAANLSTTPTAGTNSAAGNFLNVGQDPSQLRWWNGPIGEVLVYNRDLSISEIQTIERYLTTKWAIGVQPTASNADAQAWINNVYANGGLVSTATANAVNTFCTSIESAGIRDRFYRLNLFAGSNLSAALVPLFRGPSLGGTQTGNTTDTNVGPFVSGDYSETVGLTSNSDTKHLRTGLNLNAMDAFTTGHFMAAIGAYPGAAQYPIGAVDGSDRYLLQLRSDRAFWGSTTATSPASNNLISANGMATITRESATALTLYNGSTSVGTATGSVTPAGGNAEVYVYRTDEIVGSFPAYVGNMRAYSIGRAMTSAQVASFYTAMQSLQTSLGRTQA
jgi:hypothetical protein